VHDHELSQHVVSKWLDVFHTITQCDDQDLIPNGEHAMAMSPNKIQQYGDELYESLVSRIAIDPLTNR